MHTLLVALLLGGWSTAHPAAPIHDVATRDAQTRAAVADTARVPRVALAGWDRRVRLAAWDRSHSAGGVFADRGVMQRWTRAMDHEYDLDLFSALPTPADDAVFYAAENGFRTSAGSITTGHFAVESELHVSVALAHRVGLGVRLVQQEDLSARRAALELGYSVDVGRGHRVGLRHSLAEYKADLDAEVTYRYAPPAAHGATVEATVGRLDIVNNLFTETFVPSVINDDTLRVYAASPYWASGRVSVPVGRVRVEVAGGASPWSRADVHSQSDARVRFGYDSRFAFGGVLAEVTVSDALVAGAIATGTRSEASRRTPAGVVAQSDYAARQAERRVGVFALGRWRSLRGEAWAAQEWRSDRQAGTAFAGASIDTAYAVAERWTWLRARADWRPGARRGALLGAELVAGLRAFPVVGDREEIQREVLAFYPYGPNWRLTLRAGYRVSPDAEVVVGAALDLDRDPFLAGLDRRYDGAHVRLRATW